MGVKRTVERIRLRAYWPRVTETVMRFCERCEWTGPYRIVEVLSDVVFRIRLNNQVKDKVVHHRLYFRNLFLSALVIWA